MAIVSQRDLAELVLRAVEEDPGSATNLRDLVGKAADDIDGLLKSGAVDEVERRMTVLETTLMNHQAIIASLTGRALDPERAKYDPTIAEEKEVRPTADLVFFLNSLKTRIDRSLEAGRPGG